jgi:hypothetical protein
VVLDPLAEIGGGMFMAVMVGRRERMVYFQRRHKRQKGQNDEHDTNGNRWSEPPYHASVHLDLTHNGVGTYHRLSGVVNLTGSSENDDAPIHAPFTKCSSPHAQETGRGL